MNESSSSSSSRNSGRPRGGRRRRPNGPGSGSGGDQNRSSGSRDSSDYRSGGSPAASAEKPSLLQRVLSIFTGGAKKTAAPARSSSAGTGAGAAPNANRNGYGRVPSTDEFGNRTARSSREPRNSENGGGGGDSSPGRERGSRKPDSVEVTTPRLYVGNLSFETTEDHLSELFNGVGRVVSAEIVTHRQTQRSKGFAFVEMTDVAEAKRAVEQLHEKEYMGRKLFLSGAKSTEPHDGRDEPRFAS